MEFNQVKVHDLIFEKFITKHEINSRILEMGREITKKFKDLDPVFVPILNGSFVFTADLIRACDFDSELIFVKIKSYVGTSSTGEINIQLGIEKNIEDRHIIVVEDIIDTGNTLKAFIEELKKSNPASITIVSLLLKPDAIQQDIPLDYIGYRIPNAFVVGYGLDYNDLGRTLPDIYQLVENDT